MYFAQVPLKYSSNIIDSLLPQDTTYPNTEANMSSDADKALMSAVLSQIEVGKINYDKLAQDLNLPSKAAASMRWSRFKAKLNITTTPSRATNVTASTPQTTPSKGGRGKKDTPAKKRKLAISDDDDGDDERGLDIKGEPLGDENGDWGDAAGIPDTASRKLPVRMARAANFKEEVASEDEDLEGGGAFEDAFMGSRQGSTTVEGSDGVSEN